jgi:hypothetical protein
MIFIQILCESKGGSDPTKWQQAAPFLTAAAIGFLSWPFSKLIDRRIEHFVSNWNWDEDDAKSLAKWAVDASQAGACIISPLVGLFALFPMSKNNWLIGAYVGSASVSLIATILVASRKDVVEHASRMPFNMPPAATAGFVVNLACLVAVGLS